MKQLLFTLFCLFAYSSLQAQAVPTDELYGVGIWNACLLYTSDAADDS